MQTLGFVVVLVVFVVGFFKAFTTVGSSAAFGRFTTVVVVSSTMFGSSTIFGLVGFVFVIVFVVVFVVDLIN